MAWKKVRRSIEQSLTASQIELQDHGSGVEFSQVLPEDGTGRHVDSLLQLGPKVSSTSAPASPRKRLKRGFDNPNAFPSWNEETGR